MLMTIPFQIGFGRETLTERFMLMVSGMKDREGVVLGINRSLGPLINLVKQIVGAVDDNKTTEKRIYEMQVD